MVTRKKKQPQKRKPQPQKKQPPDRKEQHQKLAFTIEIETGRATGDELDRMDLRPGWADPKTSWDYVAVRCNRKIKECGTIGIYLPEKPEFWEQMEQRAKDRWEYIRLHAGQVILDALSDLTEESSLFAIPPDALKKELDGSLDLRAISPGRHERITLTTFFQGQVAMLAQEKRARLMGWDDRAILPNRWSIDPARVLHGLRIYFDGCFEACNEHRKINSLLKRKEKAIELNMPDDLYKALIRRRDRMKNGKSKDDYAYSAKQVAYIWMLRKGQRKEHATIPMSSYKTIERMIKAMGIPAASQEAQLILLC